MVSRRRSSSPIDTYMVGFRSCGLEEIGQFTQNNKELGPELIVEDSLGDSAQDNVGFIGRVLQKLKTDGGRNKDKGQQIEEGQNRGKITNTRQPQHSQHANTTTQSENGIQVEDLTIIENEDHIPQAKIIRRREIALDKRPQDQGQNLSVSREVSDPISDSDMRTGTQMRFGLWERSWV